jgi:hypothetical protein
VPLIFLIDVLDEGLKVFSRFGGFSCHECVLTGISDINYNTNRGGDKIDSFFQIFLNFSALSKANIRFSLYVKLASKTGYSFFDLC